MSMSGSAASGQQETFKIGQKGLKKNPYAFSTTNTGYSSAGMGNVTIDPSIRAIQEQNLSRSTNLYNALGEQAKNLLGNQSGYIQARVNPLEQELTNRQGQLNKNIGIRGLSGSSFGDQALTNFGIDKQRSLGDARSMATSESLAALGQTYAQQAQQLGFDAQTARDRFNNELQALGLGQGQIQLMTQAYENEQNRLAGNTGVGITHNSAVGASGGGSQGGGGSIICTAMNEMYGFGSYRNNIWVKYGVKHMTNEHRLGYHYLFLPLVNYGFKQGNGFTHRVVRKALEHIARHRTTDLRAVMKGYKRDPIGMVYRAILEPICYVFGVLVTKNILKKKEL
jgi:hypothetical protein